MAEDLFENTEAVAGLSGQMARLDQITTQFGRSLSRALSAGIVQGRSFDDILRGLGEKLIEISLRAAFKPLETGISGLLGGLVRGVTGAFTGGISGGSGLFGDLFGGGASSSGGGLFGASGQGAWGQGAAPAGVTVNMAVTTPDAESFRRSEAQVSAALARAVSRGQRSL